ncbi:MAG: ABC transporter permease [Clostridiales bacterium]|jgi:cell division transport system permease protein|nr:ABC transporter permease [Clostridiales bacterium]
MNPSSLRYLLREGFRNILHNPMMAIASVGVLVSCLLLTGGAYLAFANIEHTFEWLYSQNVVVAYARDDLTDTQLRVLEDKIKGITNIDKVEFVSRNDILKKFKDSLPKAVYEEMKGENNPFPGTFVITFKELDEFKDTVRQIEQIPEVEDIGYNENTAKALSRIRHGVLLVGGCIIFMLFLVSLFIIANTIKLTVYNRRLEISIMKSVGATNAFVRIPFIIEGIVLGIISALLSYGIVYFIYSVIFDLFGKGLMGGMLGFSSVWYIVIILFSGIGILTGLAGSAISMRKYLKDEGGISNVI